MPSGPREAVSLVTNGGSRLVDFVTGSQIELLPQLKVVM